MQINMRQNNSIKFLACLILLLFPVLVLGQTSDDEEKESNWEFSFTSYLQASAYYDNLKSDAVVNPENMLELEDTGSLAEANTQLKLIYRDNYAFYADVGYQYCPGPGNQKDRDTHFITNEMFFDFLINDWFYLKVGKKRETWGVGNLISPIDIINPPKNPVDPSLSREGSYLGLLEIPIRSSALTMVYFPETELNKDGIPEDIPNDYPDYGVRTYFLIKDIDVSLIYYRKDLIPTLMKNYYGLAVIKYFGDLGLYFDGLAHEGKDLEYVKYDQQGGYYYWPDQEQWVAEAKLDDEFVVNFSTGLDYTFLDDTKINLEYFRNGDGYMVDEFDMYYDFFENDSFAYLQSDPRDENIANKLKKGAGLLSESLRRNYLAIFFQRPSTFDDFFPRLLFNTCLDDGSFLFNAALDYNITERFTLTFDVKSFIGSEDAEFGMTPDDYKFTLRVRYYF